AELSILGSRTVRQNPANELLSNFKIMASTTFGDWRDTDLWRTLQICERPDARSVQTTLEVGLPDIQTILHSGLPSKDFVLHDENPSFRVAQRMLEVIPASVVPHLAARELGLLLLSAYLHDIGMTPQQALVDRHYTYVVTGKSDLPDSDREE